MDNNNLPVEGEENVTQTQENLIADSGDVKQDSENPMTETENVKQDSDNTIPNTASFSEESGSNYDDNEIVDIKKAKKKYFASFLWKLTLAIAAILIIQAILVLPQTVFFGFLSGLAGNIDNGFFGWYKEVEASGVINTITAVSSYVFLMISVGIGALLLFLLTKKSAVKPERKSMGFGWWLAIFISCFGIGGLGSIIGAIVNGLIMLPASLFQYLISSFAAILSGSNVVDNLIYADDSWLYLFVGIITVGIVIPILEELIFRRLVIDSTSKYGFGAAIMISAFTFAVYHGNFTQFFYAFMLGLIFAYIYCNTGKLRYTVLLHMGYNLYASAVIPLARKMIHPDVTNTITNALDQVSQTVSDHPGMFFDAMDLYFIKVEGALNRHPLSVVGIFLTAAVVLFYYFLSFVGIILCIVFIKKALKVRKSMMLGEKGTKRCAAFNFGAILFYVLGAGFFIFYYGVNYLAVLVSPFI